MPPARCHEIDRRIWSYIDRELSASEISLISAHLRECEACRGLYHERAREASQYRMAFLDAPFGEKFVAKMRRRLRESGLLEAPQPGAQEPHSRGGRFTQEEPWDLRGFSRRRMRRLAVVAAMLLGMTLIVVLGIVSNGSPTSLGSFQAKGGVVSVARVEGRGNAIGQGRDLAGGNLFGGSTLGVPAGVHAVVTLARPGGGTAASLDVAGPAEFIVDPSATSKLLVMRLSSGVLEASVAKRGPDEEFRLLTPHAEVVVVGTRFQVEASQDATFLEVLEGTVRFQATEGLPGANSEAVTKSSGRYLVRDHDSRPTPVKAAVASVGRDHDEPETGSGQPPAAPDAPAVPSTPHPPTTPADSPSPDLDNPVSGEATPR